MSPKPMKYIQWDNFLLTITSYGERWNFNVKYGNSTLYHGQKKFKSKYNFKVLTSVYEENTHTHLHFKKLKTWHFCISYSFCYENMYCGYSFELPHKGKYNYKYSQYMFLWKYKKCIYLAISLIWTIFLYKNLMHDLLLKLVKMGHPSWWCCFIWHFPCGIARQIRLFLANWCQFSTINTILFSHTSFLLQTFLLYLFVLYIYIQLVYRITGRWNFVFRTWHNSENQYKKTAEQNSTSQDLSR